MEEAARPGYTEDGCRLASGRLPPLLEMALPGQALGRQETYQHRDSRFGFPHGHGESYLGSATHSRRAVDARLRPFRNDGLALVTASPETSKSRPALAHVPQESS